MHHPYTAMAAHTGEPTMVDPQQTSAVELVRNANASLMGAPPAKTGSGVSLETHTSGQPPADNAAPAPAGDTAAAPAPAPTRANDAATDSSSSSGDSQANAQTSST